MAIKLVRQDEFDKQIADINKQITGITSRGYTARIIKNTLEECNESGKYIVALKDIPGIDSGTYGVDVTAYGSNLYVQRLCTFNTYLRSYIRIVNDEVVVLERVITEPQLNALVEKVAILATPKAGITIDNKSYRINKVAHISLSASKTDGTLFSNTAPIGEILTMSLQTPSYSNVLSVLCLTEGGTPYGVDTACYSNDGSLYIGKPAINAKHIRVTGTLLLN